jgi:acetyl-CoA C-acetyltransferase
MKEVVIAGAVRTAIGGFGGSLASVPASELSIRVMSEAVKRGNVDPESIDKVIFGNCFSPADCNIARIAAYQAGIPDHVPAFSVNATCGSGLQAVISGCQAIQCGEADVVLAGGVESMSRAPYVMEATRWGQQLRHARAFDLVWGVMQEYPIGDGMGLTAENLAEKYDISRAEQDQFALLSHQRAAAAVRERKFEAEILPIAVKSKRKKSVVFETDEHVRPDLTMDKLAKLPPAFKKGGTVTAGNACGMNDGAAAIILASRAKADELGLDYSAKIKDYHVAGVEPSFMGIGPVPAIRTALKKADLNIEDIDRFEINEAFAAQYLACEKELSLNRDKVNVHGSGIALGHPVGATGCRLIVTLQHILAADGCPLGIASLCAGGGMGFAIILEMV